MTLPSHTTLRLGEYVHGRRAVLVGVSTDGLVVKLGGEKVVVASFSLTSPLTCM